MCNDSLTLTSTPTTSTITGGGGAPGGGAMAPEIGRLLAPAEAEEAEGEAPPGGGGGMPAGGAPPAQGIRLINIPFIFFLRSAPGGGGGGAAAPAPPTLADLAKTEVREAAVAAVEALDWAEPEPDLEGDGLPMPPASVTEWVLHLQGALGVGARTRRHWRGAAG